MSIVDKKGLLKKIDAGDTVALELGCGQRKRHPEAIGIDLRDLPGVDIVGDALEVLRQLPPNAVSAVYSYHFFEHLEHVDACMIEWPRWP